MSARHSLLLPVAATAAAFVLTACGSTPTAAPISAAPTSAAPTSAAPADGAPASARPVGTGSSPAGTGAGNCPSADALEKLTDLPKDWHFVPSSVECWKGWARADPQGPNAGDGVYLFQYKAGSGWRFHSEGSAFECKDLGITEPSPFCQRP